MSSSNLPSDFVNKGNELDDKNVPNQERKKTWSTPEIIKGDKLEKMTQAGTDLAAVTTVTVDLNM